MRPSPSTSAPFPYLGAYIALSLHFSILSIHHIHWPVVVDGSWRQRLVRLCGCMPNQQVDTIMTAASDHREIMCTGNRPQPLRLATNNNNNIIVSIDRLYGKKTCLWTDDGGYCLPRGGPERRKKKRLQGWRRRRSRPTWHTRQEIYSVEGWPPPPQNHIHKLHCSAFVGVPGNTVGGHLILYRTGGLKRRNRNASQVFTIL